MRIRVLQVAVAVGKYAVQKITKYEYDKKLEQEIKAQADKYLSGEIKNRGVAQPKKVNIQSLNLSDTERFHLVRDDFYSRFSVSPDGAHKDSFGRRGAWVPRGSKLYLDNEKNEFVKIFEEYFCLKGEGAFLEEAIEQELYRFLCPGLKYLLIDENGSLRGYSIGAGRVLTHYEFERYIGTQLRGVIEAETKRTNYYFYDLTRQNVIIKDRQISLIDLESVLPVSWFGQGIEFARQHLDKVDLGRAYQDKWCSPRWYKKFIEQLLAIG